MSEHSPNLNLNLYSGADGEEKFRSFVEKLAGPGADSNMMLLDAAIKAQAEKLKKAALLDGTGKLPDSLLPEIGAEHIPFIPGSAFQSAVGDASNVSEALENIGKVSADAYAHIENTNNPHGVTAEKINAVPVSRTINGQPLSNDITLSPSDIGITAKRTCRFVVGTSTAGWTADDCDFLCDGVDDQVEIQAALDALPEIWNGSAGIVTLLSGKYNLSGDIRTFKSAIIQGEGMGTVVSSTKGKFTVNASGIIIKNIRFLNSTTTRRFLLQIEGGQARVDNCYFSNGGIYIFDLSQDTCGAEVYIVNNHFFLSLDRNDDAIYNYKGNGAVPGKTKIVIAFNVIEGNPASVDGSGICVTNVSPIVVGNTIRNVRFGLLSHYMTCGMIIGNVFMRGSGSTADYTSTQGTIYLEGIGNSYNYIVNNIILGKNFISDGGTSNTFVNNKYN